MVYALTYDLNKAGQDYPSLYSAIKSMGSWCLALQNLWFIDTFKSPLEIRQAIQNVTDSNDHIFVSEVTTSWSGYMNKEAIKWLQSRI